MKSFLVIFSLFWSSVLYAQKTTEEDSTFLAINRCVHWLNGVDPSVKDDLSFLKEAVGKSSIVVLGEATHLDATTMKAQYKVINYLHKELGFDLLLIEDGMFTVKNYTTILQREKDFPYGIDILFGRTLDEGDFRFYYNNYKSKRPITVAGYDLWTHTTRGYASFLRTLGEFLISIGQEAYVNSRHWSQFEKLCSTNVFLSKQLDTLDAELNLMCSFIKEVSNSTENQLWDRILQNYLLNQREYNHEDFKRYEYNPSFDFHEKRDSAMAENIQFLLDTYYKGKKAIIITSSYHAFRNANKVRTAMADTVNWRKATPMGDRLWNKYGRAVYSIAFIRHGGRFGFIDCLGSFSSKKVNNDHTQRVETPPQGSLEQMLYNQEHKYGFIDFRGLPINHSLRSPFYMHAAIRYAKVNWTEVFDGTFYIQEMEPFVLVDDFSLFKKYKIDFSKMEKKVNQPEKTSLNKKRN